MHLFYIIFILISWFNSLIGFLFGDGLSIKFVGDYFYLFSQCKLYQTRNQKTKPFLQRSDQFIPP